MIGSNYSHKTRDERHLRKMALLIACACAIAGCSTSFTYKRLDWLIPWHIDNYVDLDRKQNEILESKLEQILRWHRYKELHQYIGTLDRIEQDLQSRVTSETVISWIDDIKQAMDRVENTFLNMALELGTTMSDAQIDEFRENLRKSQRDYEKEYLARDDEEYRKDSYKSLTKNLRRFAGRMNPDQKRRLQLAADSLLRFDARWLADRELWIRKLDSLLKREDGWQQAVLDAHGNRERMRSSQYQFVLDHNMAILSTALADVLNQLDSKQRQKLIKKIAGLRKDLQKLGKPPTRLNDAKSLIKAA
jgi:hypothetical protein